MITLFTATASIVINAPASAVWDAITNPATIKKYFFDVDVVTDWRVGSPIIYKGVWQGTPFEDKGTVLQIEPQRLLATNYWSGFSGMPDVPENYQNVTYTLAPEGSATRVTITQTNITSEQSRDHSQQNWMMVLDAMKKLLEG